MPEKIPTPSELLAAIERRESKAEKETSETRALWKKFGRMLRRERRKIKMPLATFAHKLGYSRAMAGYLEAGVRPWSREKAREAVKILGGGRHPLFPNCPVSAPAQTALT